MVTNTFIKSLFVFVTAALEPCVLPHLVTRQTRLHHSASSPPAFIQTVHRGNKPESMLFKGTVHSNPPRLLRVSRAVLKKS